MSERDREYGDSGKLGFPLLHLRRYALKGSVSVNSPRLHRRFFKVRLY